VYYFLFIVYVILSSAVFLLFFLWALKHGQFKDQQRARFLPLVEEQGQKVPGPGRPSKFGRYQVHFFFCLLFSGAAAVVVVLVYVIIGRG
jgi:cbb3-type cytochrome oxidase maturation protein